MKKLLLIAVLFTAVPRAQAGKPHSFGTQDYIRALKQITDVMVNDVTSPVAASRYYAYLNLSAWEVQSACQPAKYPTLAGTLNGFNALHFIPAPPSTDPHLSVIIALYKAAQKLLPSGHLFKMNLDSMRNKYGKSGMDAQPYRMAETLADTIVAQVIRYARADGFTKLNNLPRYIVRDGPGYWNPTPPVFMAPVEPHWNTIRPFVIDSAQEYKVLPPAPYDTATSSPFYKMMKEVYDISEHPQKEQLDIAEFWDCNPFAVQQIGHVEYGVKKISPGGHWIGITGICCEKQKLSFEKTVAAHLYVSIALADAFIACWDEKYRSNRIRPETVIQRMIRPDWHPLLQTPPFPEYVSGHSVASTSASVVLSAFFGDGFTFADNSEVEFGLPVRTFSSFKAAAEEASVSRLYGGIHYRDAIDQGIWQGRKVGEHVQRKLGTILGIAHK